jgi:hypothetical protein
VNLRCRSLSPPANRSSLFLRTYRTSHGRLLSTPSRSLAGARAAATTAAGRRRFPTRACSPPQLRLHLGPRWACTRPTAVPRPGKLPELPEFGRARRLPCPGTPLQAPKSFRGVLCDLSVDVWDFEKLQGPRRKTTSSIVLQFCWFL